MLRDIRNMDKSASNIEFVFGDYEELVGAYQQGVIDILPVFEMESNEKLFLEGKTGDAVTRTTMISPVANPRFTSTWRSRP